MKEKSVFSASLFIMLILSFAAVLLPSCRSINVARTKLPRSFVILSFDDGPNIRGNTTARLLDLLKKYRVTAMFALLGANAERYPDLVRRIYAEGHYIINHGYSDKWAFRMTRSEFRENLLKGEAAISAALGHELPEKFYRPQGGYYLGSQRRIWRRQGYSLVPGSIRVFDAVLTDISSDRIVRTIVAKTEQGRGGIVLLHDARDTYDRADAFLEVNPEGSFNRSWIPDAVEEIIIALREDGYRFSETFPGEWGLIFD